MPAQGVYLVAEADLDRRAYQLLLEQIGTPPQAVSGFAYREIADALQTEPRVMLLVADRPTPQVREVLRMTTERDQTLRLLVIAAADDPALFRAWCQIQPQGTLSRCAGLKELARALETVARGGLYLDHRWQDATNDWIEPSTLPKLSPRERELLPLLAMGMKLKQAASVMEVSYKTADTYRTNLFRKLGVSNRVELSRYAIREQILDA